MQSRVISRRQVIGSGLAASVSIMLAACGGSGSSGGGNGGVPAATTGSGGATVVTGGGATAATGGGAMATTGAGATATPTAAPAVGSGATKLQYMVWGRPDGVNWSYLALNRAYPDDAKRYSVQPVIGGSGDVQVAQKLRLMLSAGDNNLPDIVALNRTEVPEFAAADLLYDMTDLIKPFADDMVDTAKALATVDGKMVALPVSLKPKVWYYRQDVFQKAGVDPDKIVTFDDFIAAGKQIHQAVPQSYIYNIKAKAGGYAFDNFLTSFAPVSFYDRQAKKFQVATHPGFRATYDLLTKLQDPAVSATVDNFDPDWSQAFASNMVVSSLINEWMSSFLPLYVPEQKGLWRVHAWPGVNGTNKGSDAGGQVAVIPKKSKNPKAAFEYLSKIYLTKQGALANIQTSSQTPYLKSARAEVPSLAKPAADLTNANALPWPPEFFGADYFNVIFAAQDRMTWIDYDPAAAKELSIRDDWTQRYLAKQASLDQTITGLQNDLAGQIGDPWQV